MNHFYKRLTRSEIAFLLIVFAVVLLSVFNVRAADGDLDTSFAGTGFVNETFTGSASRLYSVLVQPDGKIVAAGQALSSNFTNDYALIRYNANGTVDTTFGTGGRVYADVDARNDIVPTVLLQPDGKFVLVGISTNSQSRNIVAVLRFNQNGAPDATFGTNGRVLTEFPDGNSSSASDAVLQPDGKIVVIGQWSGTAYCVARYNANGALDQTFGTGGSFCANTNGTGAFNSVALQPDGKIVAVGGYTTSFTIPFNFIVLRFNQNGTADTTFDGDGFVTTDFNGGADNATSVFVQPNGQILAVGGAAEASGTAANFALARYNQNGALDAAFGTGGKATALPDAATPTDSAALLANGKIVVGRYRNRQSPNIGTESQFARFNPNGALDQTFGAGGQTIFAQMNQVQDLVLQPDGKIVAVGGNQNNQSITARFQNTDTAPPVVNPTLRFADFDGDGKSDVAVFRAGTWFVNPSSAPSLADAPEAAFGVQFGQAGDIPVPADYDGDGKADIAVFRNAAFANFYILNSSNNTFRAEQFGTGGDNPTVAGDWDADGKADLAVYRSGAPSFFYYRPSSQPGVNFIPVQWGTSGDAPIFGDFDGDRRLDAAVYRPANSTFYVRQSATGSALVRQWGNAQTDAIFAGDFDGDGKSDFAVQRFSGTDAGTWYVAQSGGNPATRAFVWGAGTDTPVPADYDGDGKMDVAVFRRANRTWFILASSDNQPRYSVFGASSDFPLPLNLVR